MSITIGNYSFEGPFNNASYLKDKPGVYAILCRNNGKYHPVDLGESETVKSRVENHDRLSCWKRNCNGNGTLTVAVLYTSNGQQNTPNRQQIEQEIRNQYNFPCGER